MKPRPATPLRPVIREARCAEMSGLDRWSRRRLEAEGRFPRRIKIGKRSVAWFLDEVAAWQETLARGEEWREPADV